MDNSYDSFDPSVLLKITDFGLAHIIPPGSNKAYIKYKCGTFSYTAPEVTNVNYK